MKAIVIVIPSVLPRTVTYRLMLLAPRHQAGADIVLIGIHTGTQGNRRSHQRLDGCLLDIGQHPYDLAQPRWISPKIISFSLSSMSRKESPSQIVNVHDSADTLVVPLIIEGKRNVKGDMTQKLASL